MDHVNDDVYNTFRLRQSEVVSAVRFTLAFFTDGRFWACSHPLVRRLNRSGGNTPLLSQARRAEMQEPRIAGLRF